MQNVNIIVQISVSENQENTLTSYPRYLQSVIEIIFEIISVLFTETDDAFLWYQTLTVAPLPHRSRAHLLKLPNMFNSYPIK